MTFELSTIEQALDFLTSADTPDVDIADLQFSGELARFETVIDGKNYHGTVPTALARGLWELQEELYRAAAFALYGEDSIRRLTDEQREKFELIFEVKEGSTDLVASLKDFINKLAEGFANMESGHKAKVLVAIIAIVAATWGGTEAWKVYSELKQKEITASTEIQKTQIQTSAENKSKEISNAGIAAQQAAETARLQIFSDFAKHPSVARFAKASEEGTKAVIKGASDADSIRVGKAYFDRSAIIEVNQRAAKERSEARIVTEEFHIVRMEFQPAALRVWVASRSYNEFPVNLIHGDLDQEDEGKIIAAARARQPIRMELNITLIREQVRAAQVVRVY